MKETSRVEDRVKHAGVSRSVCALCAVVVLDYQSQTHTPSASTSSHPLTLTLTQIILIIMSKA